MTLEGATPLKEIVKDSTFGLHRNDPVVSPIPTPKEEVLRAIDADSLGLSAAGEPPRDLAQQIRHEHLGVCCAQKGCKVRLGLRPSPDHDGKLACAWHDTARRQKKIERGATTRDKKRPLEMDDLPVQEILTIDDALALSTWVPFAVIMGDIDTKQAAVIVASIREYRMIEADKSSLARVKALEDQIKALAEQQTKGSR